MTRLLKTLIVSTLLVLFAYPDAKVAQAQDDKKMSVFTSLAPVSFVVAEIGGDRLDVHTLIPLGRDPHNFSPSPRQVVALAEAQIYFTVGMSFEKELLGRLASSHNNLRIANSSLGIVKRHMDHDHHHRHQGAQGDPHIWLGIKPLAQMATNIAATLSHAAPDNQHQFQKNLALFLERLTRLETDVRLTFEPFEGRSFLVFHPSFGYFADSFNLVQEAVEIEGKSPSPRQLAAIIKMARKKDIRVIFVQPQFDKRAAKSIAEAIGGQVLTMDPLAANLFENLREMAEKIATALGK